jgi:hypothetical protein
MRTSTYRRAGWLASTLMSLVLAGCGGGGIKLSGKVTLDGQPLESGSVTFSPEDGQGQPVGGGIEEGEFTVVGLTPGKKRVKVTLAAEGETKPTNQRQRMQEIKDERRASKADRSQGKPAPKPLQVTDIVVEVMPDMAPVTLEFKSRHQGR